MKKDLLSGIIISDDYYLCDMNYKLPVSLEEKIDEYYSIAISDKKSGIKKLERAIKKYPNVPVLRNLLSVLYENLGKIEKSKENIINIYKKYPDYLYGRLNYASLLIAENKLDKIPELLGPNLLLTEAFPNRKVYHIDEFISFLKTSIKYYAHTNPDEARKRMEILEEYGSPEDIVEMGMALIQIYMDNNENGLDGLDKLQDLF